VIPLWGWEESGIASWYGGKFQGRLTANGEVFDTYKYTAAHKTLPFGTVLEVLRPESGMSVKVRINDRGPFVDGRIIDLSYAAAKAIDMIRDGTAPVVIRTLDGGELPLTLFTVQVGAWKDIENASICRRHLEGAGLDPRASLGPDGVIRIAVERVKEEEIFALVGSLESLGYGDLWIRQE
jgi:rare lipoprotein A